MREDEIVKNKYNLPIGKQCFEDYIDRLIGKLFKILPIYEGKAIYKEIIYTPEQAYQHYKIHLEEVIVEIVGDYYLYNNNSKFLELLSILEGLKNVGIDEHQTVRAMVFKCTNLCSELKELNDNEDK